MTRIRSASERISSSSKGDEEDRAALIALLDESAVHELDRPHVEPRVGWAARRDARVAFDFTRDHDLLLVAARQRRGPRERSSAAHVERLEKPPRACDQPARKEPAETRVGRLVVVVERDVLGEREVEHEPAARWRSSGMWPRPASSALRAPSFVISLPPTVTRPAWDFRRPGHGVDQLRLAVPVDAGDPDDLACAYVERHVAHGFEAHGRRARSGPPR